MSGGWVAYANAVAKLNVQLDRGVITQDEYRAKRTELRLTYVRHID